MFAGTDGASEKSIKTSVCPTHSPENPASTGLSSMSMIFEIACPCSRARRSIVFPIFP